VLGDYYYDEPHVVKVPFPKDREIYSVLIDCSSSCIYRMLFVDKEGQQILTIGNYVYDTWKVADISGASGERLIGFEVSLGGYEKNIIKGLRMLYLDLIGINQ